MKRLALFPVRCAIVCLAMLFAGNSSAALSLTDIAATARPECSLGGASDGERYLIGLQLDGQSNAVQFVSAAGLPDGSLIPVPGALGMPPDIAYGSNVYLAVWAGFDGAVYGQIIATNGTLQGAPFQVAPTNSVALDFGTCRTAFGGGRFLVAWEDTRLPDGDSDPYPDEEDPDIFAQLVNPDGSLFSTNSLVSGSGDGDDGNLSIGFDGINFLVVYSSEMRAGIHDGEDVRARFVSPATGPIGSPFVVDQNDIPSSNPTATLFAGGQYAVLFHESVALTNAESWQIYARFVSTNGSVSGSRALIAGSETSAAQFPSIGWNGSQFLVALRESAPEQWTEGSPGSEEEFLDTNGVIRVRWFDAALQPVSGWIDVTGTFGSNEAALAAMILPAETGFTLGIQTLTTNWIPVNVYGALIDESTSGPAGPGDDFNDNSKDPEKWGADAYFSTNTAAVLNETNGRLEFTKPANADSEGVIRPWIQTAGSYTQNWEVAVDVHLGDVLLPEENNSWININLAVSRVNDTNWLHAVPVSLDLYRDGASVHRGYEMEPLFNGLEVTNAPGYGYLTTADRSGRLSLRFDAATKVISGYCNGTLLGQVDVDTPGSDWEMNDNDRFGFALVGSTGSESLGVASGDVYADNFAVTGSVPATPPSQFESVSIWRSLGLDADGSEHALFETDVTTSTTGKTITVTVPTDPETVYTLSEDEGPGNYECFVKTNTASNLQWLDTQYPQGNYVLRIYSDAEKTVLEETLTVPFEDGSAAPLPFPETFPSLVQPAPSGGLVSARPDQTYTWSAYSGTTGTASHMFFDITGTGENDTDIAWYDTDIQGTCAYTPQTVSTGTYDIELGFLARQSGPAEGGIWIECANERYVRYTLTVANASPDADGNGLPDAWEQQYFGATGIDTNTVCSNGVNTAMEAYIAGLDPTDPNTFFGITGGDARKGTFWWNGASGRVYSVWWTPSLMSSFQCIASNIAWTAGGFTDTVHNAESKGFYKLKVQLEP